MRGHAAKFTRADPSTVGTSDHAEDNQVNDAAPRGKRRQQSAETDWLITSPQPGVPTDARLIPNYGGHIAKVIFEGAEHTPPILECLSRKKPLEAIIRLQDMSDELYEVLPATLLGRLPHIMHQHIDSVLITAFVEKWQPDTNTFHMSWGEMIIMLHDVQRILGVGIEGSLPANPLRVSGSSRWPVYLESQCPSCVERGTSLAGPSTLVKLCTRATGLRL